MEKDVSPELKSMLDYFDGREPSDDFSKKLDDAVRKIKENKEWRRAYMGYREELLEHERIGEKIGEKYDYNWNNIIAFCNSFVDSVHPSLLSSCYRHYKIAFYNNIWMRR